MSGPIAGAMQTQVLAPDAVTRLGGQATEVRTDVWEVTMGASVAAFVMANGPARLAMARAALRLLQLHAAPGLSTRRSSWSTAPPPSSAALVRSGWCGTQSRAMRDRAPSRRH